MSAPKATSPGASAEARIRIIPMSDQQHIVSSFDRDLETIQAQIMKMGGMVERAIADAARSLETRDEELAEEVRGRDKAIDALEEQINEEAARVIALRAPTARDLRLVLTVIKVSASLERIGDYAKNMAKRTRSCRAWRPSTALLPRCAGWRAR